MDHKSVGPFKILELIGIRAFRLKLPKYWKRLHSVFHVSLLDPYHQSSIPGRKQSPPPPEIIDGEEEWEIENVANSRYNKRSKRVEYLIYWKGFTPVDATWEPAEQFIHEDEAGETVVARAVVRFHKGYPKKPIDPLVEKILKDL